MRGFVELLRAEAEVEVRAKAEVEKHDSPSQARNRLAGLLEESKSEEVVIRRRRGDMFSIVPRTPSRRSPFSVPALDKHVSRKEILAAIRESRKQSDRSSGPKRDGRLTGTIRGKKRVEAGE